MGRKFDVVTVYLTKKCSMKCSHCKLWTHNSKELPPESWIDIFTSIRDEWNPHIGILGGEPLEYYHGFESILKLVKLMNRADISYSIASNSTLLTESKAKRLTEVGLLNWSPSIDYPSCVKDKRSRAGFQALDWFKKYGVADLHVTVTVYPGNIPYLKRLIDELIEKDVWIELTFAMWSKNRHYDAFPTTVKPRYTQQELKILKNTIDYIKNLSKDGYKIHASPTYYEWDVVLTMLNAKFDCRELTIPMINSDGKLNLCRDISGARIRNFRIEHLIDERDIVENVWLKEKHNMCKGCNWSCAYFSIDGLKEGFKHAVI